MKKTLVLLFFFALVLVSPLPGQTIKLGGVIKNDAQQGAQHQFKITALAKTTTLDSIVDLSAYAPTPLDQGNQGSCASCAVAGLVGMMENQAHGYSLNNQFSPSFLFNLVNYNGTGSSSWDNLQLVCDQGIPLLTEFPYHDTGYSTIPSLDVFKSALNHRALSWSFFTGGDTVHLPGYAYPVPIPGFLGVNTARELLASGHPLLLCVGLTTQSREDTLMANNWIFSWASQGTGEATSLHEVYVIGYNDSLKTRDGKGAFRVRMSSGPNHFDHGDLWVTYQAVGLWQQMEFCTLTMRQNYQSELTVEIESEFQHFAGRFYSGFKVNNQTVSENVFAWATIGTQLQLQKKLPEHLPVDLTDVANSLSGSNSFVYFIKGPFRKSQFSGNYPKLVKLHIRDSVKGIDAIINTNLTITDSLFYAEWPVTITGVAIENPGLPSTFSLSQNYPNPFNPTTVINFSLPKSGHASLKVYNLLGQEVAILIDEDMNAGAHNTKFDAGNLASGIYLYTLQANGFSQTKKMIFVK